MRNLPLKIRKPELKNLEIKKPDLSSLSQKDLLTVIAAVLITVFILAICVSIGLFVKAGNQSHNNLLLDAAVSEVSTIAETLKAADGDPEETAGLLRTHQTPSVTDNGFTLYYGESMEPATESTAFYKAVVTVTPEDRHNSYSIIISDIAGETVIYQLDFKYVTGGDVQ